METTLKRQSVKQDLMILFAVTAIAFASYQATTIPYYLPTKIEDGTVIVRNDSVTTVVIPDKR